ncbi:MAG: energy-coupling factor transporter transmembrane protein EcfT [Anaerolineales bacterium]|nr:energy-coupling factor transporter transmembrane protein EcfT [Anaerolineales bacterium]
MRTVYLQGDSLLHRLNPLSKFLVNLALFIFVLFTNDPWAPLAFIALTVLVLVLLGRVPLLRLVKLMTPLVLIATVFLLMYPLAVRQSLVDHTPLLWQWGPLRVYAGSLDHALATALRILALLALSLPFSLTTDSADFIRALVQQGRLPYRVGYSTLAAFGFIPMLQNEVSVIGAAHRVRGVNGTAGWRGAYERLRRYAVPLLTGAIRQAERTALAMDGRAFGALPQRTYFQRMRFTAVDWLFVFGMLAVSALLVFALYHFGLLGELSLLKIL